MSVAYLEGILQKLFHLWHISVEHDYYDVWIFVIQREDDFGFSFKIDMSHMIVFNVQTKENSLFTNSSIIRKWLSFLEIINN